MSAYIKNHDALQEPRHFHNYKAVHMSIHVDLLFIQNQQVFSAVEIDDFLKGWKIQNPEHKKSRS